MQGRSTSHSISVFFWMTNNKVRRRPHVYVFDWKRRFFFFVLTHRPHVSGEFGHENASFQKRRTFVYIWTDENRGFRVRWRHASYTSTYIHRFVDWRKRFEYTLRVDVRNLSQTGKRFSVFKNIRIPMDGALIQVYAVDKGMKLAGVKTKVP